MRQSDFIWDSQKPDLGQPMGTRRSPLCAALRRILLRWSALVAGVDHDLKSNSSLFQVYELLVWLRQGLLAHTPKTV